jgi:hypothetical protein
MKGLPFILIYGASAAVMVAVLLWLAMRRR